jgi:hypothetical protein
MLMMTPYPVFIRVTSVGCPLHMLRAGKFRNPSLPCAVMKIQTLDHRISGVVQNHADIWRDGAHSRAALISRRSAFSNRGHFTATHILDPRFTQSYFGSASPISE